LLEYTKISVLVIGNEKHQYRPKKALSVELYWVPTNFLNTLRAGVRYIRTSISASNQQLSVALPTP